MRTSSVGINEGKCLKKARHGENTAHDALVVAKDQEDAAANEGDEVVELPAAAEQVLREERKRHGQDNDSYDTPKKREGCRDLR